MSNAGIWLMRDIAQSLIRWLAVLAGQQNRMLGVAVLTMAILARVVTIVAMFRLVERSASPSTAAPAMAAGGRPGCTAQLCTGCVRRADPVHYLLCRLGPGGREDASYGLLSLPLDQLGRYGPLVDVPADRIGIIWLLAAWAIRRGQVDA